VKVPLVDLKAQYQSIKNEIDSAIQECINDSSFIGGERVHAFEKSFAEFLGIKNCIGCANGTDAIELVLKGLGIGSGDEVIVPAYTWISTAEAPGTVGANPVFVDVVDGLYTIDYAKIEEKISSKTKAIIPVHLYGLPAEMDEIMEIANRHSLKVIEDCAQAHGAAYKGKKVGNFGHASTFSFYPSKNLGAYGDAGCMVTNADDLALQLRMLSNHGQQGKNNHFFEGRNSRLDTIQAMILSVKLQKLDQWTLLRIKNAELYKSKLQGTKIGLPQNPDYSKHVYHVFVIQIEERDKVINVLAEAGIGTAIHYPLPLPFTKPYEHLGYSPDDFPVSSGMSGKILSLPMYPELTEEQIDFVCDTLLDWV